MPRVTLDEWFASLAGGPGWEERGRKPSDAPIFDLEMARACCRRLGWVLVDTQSSDDGCWHVQIPLRTARELLECGGVDRERDHRWFGSIDSGEVTTISTDTEERA